MKKRVVKKRNGFRISDRDAGVIGKSLERLSKKHKRWPTSEEVLEDARDSKSPLHRFFDWDDYSAAEKYRLSQASYIIRAVRVIYVDDDRETEIGRGLYNVKVTDDNDEIRNEHRPIEVIAGNPDDHQQVIDYAMRQLETWQRQYEHLQKVPEFSKIFREVFLAIGTARAKTRKSTKKTSRRKAMSA